MAKPKDIKPGEVFLLNGTPYSYRIENGDVILRKGETKKKFIAPTVDEVIKFFTDKGYRGGKEFHEYYGVANWHDGKGNPIINWKQKALAVWFRDERKILTLADAEKQAEQSGNSGMVY